MQKLAIILIIVLGIAVYANSVSGKFLWDDRHLIEENAHIKSASGFSKILAGNIRMGAKRKSSAYRPVQILSYALDYKFWKLNPLGYHITNVALHIVTSFVVYWLVLVLFRDKVLSFLTAVFFVVHPIHTGAVSYISGRADMLGATFMLLAFIFYLNRHDRESSKLPHMLTLFFYSLALLSRESALVLPLLILLYHYFFRKKINSVIFMPVCGLAFLYGVLRVTLLRNLLSEMEYSSTLLQRIPGFFVAVTNYLRLLVAPFNMHMEYGNKEFAFTNPQAILGIIIFASLLAVAVKQKEKRPVFSFSVLWFFVALLPASNIFPINAYMAEHWLYIPSIGFFMILAKGLLFLRAKLGTGGKRPTVPFSGISFSRNDSIVIITALLVTVYFSVFTIKQNTYWREPISFYEKTLEFAPDSARVYNNLALTYRGRGEHKKALELLEKARDVDPGRSGTYNNLGLIYEDMGDEKKALSAFKKATEANPRSPAAYGNIGRIYYSRGNKAEAEKAFKKAIQNDPDYAEGYYILGNISREAGKTEDAIRYYTSAIKRNPNYADAYINIGLMYKDMGKYGEAIYCFEKAIKLKPDLSNAYNNLGGMYVLAGRFDDAITAFKKAIKIKPDHPEAYNNMAIVYFHGKRYEEAIECSDKAKELGLDNALLREALEYYRIAAANGQLPIDE